MKLFFLGVTYKSVYPNDGETSLYWHQKSLSTLPRSPRHQIDDEGFPMEGSEGWHKKYHIWGPSTKFAGQRADGLADGALEPGGGFPFHCSIGWVSGSIKLTHLGVIEQRWRYGFWNCNSTTAVDGTSPRWFDRKKPKKPRTPRQVNTMGPTKMKRIPWCGRGWWMKNGATQKLYRHLGLLNLITWCFTLNQSWLYSIYIYIVLWVLFLSRYTKSIFPGCCQEWPSESSHMDCYFAFS